MKRILRKLRRSNIFIRYLYYLLIIVYIIIFGIFIKNIIALKGIETIIRYILIILFSLWLLFYLIFNFFNLLIRKYKRVIITSIITIFFLGIFMVSSYYIKVIYKGINTITNNNSSIHTSYLIKLKDQEFNSDSLIGRIKNELDEEGFILTNNIIEKNNLSNKIKDFDDYLDLVYTLYEKKVDAIFVPSNYISLFESSEGLENISKDTEIIYSYTLETEKENESLGSNKDFTEPLTFLLMGVDSTIDGLNPNAGFNGDTLMLITVNPKTLETLMFSIPRDTYVPIACNNNKYSKINSSAGFGSSCVIDTVSAFLDVDIDYYVKINFKGVVALVEALGGVEVDVEAPSYNGSQYNGQMCEQNSDRQFGDHLICLSPGLQTLNGEEALAYSRNRHLYIGGDLDRIRHQQQVVEAIARKLLNFSTFADFKKIIDAISKNISTNMSTDKILSGYNVVKEMVLNALNGEEFININKATLETYSLPVYLPNSGTYTSAQGYYVDSLDDIKNNLKRILEGSTTVDVKDFTFNINEEYSIPVIGKGKKNVKSLELMPNLIGSSVSKAEEFCNTHNIILTKEYVSGNDAHHNADVAVGLIADQSVQIGTLLNNVIELTIYISNNTPSNSSTNNKDNEKTDAEKEEKPKEDDTDLSNFNLF